MTTRNEPVTDFLSLMESTVKSAKAPGKRTESEFLEITPNAWPRSKEDEETEQECKMTGKVAPSKTFFELEDSPFDVDYSSFRSVKKLETLPKQSVDESHPFFEEQILDDVATDAPGLHKFDKLLQTISRIPAGALKDLHYAALEGVLEGELAIKTMQQLIPGAGQQFCDLYHEAMSGSAEGAAVFDTLREFQKQLRDTFDIVIEISDTGIYICEGHEESVSLKAWTFIPTEGQPQFGAKYVEGLNPVSHALDHKQALARIRTKLSSALEIASLAS